MSDSDTPASASLPGGSSERLTAPSSSTMLANYLSDLEQLLEEHRWEQARREASDLPEVAAALANPTMQTSGTAVRQWCERWLALPASPRPPSGTEPTAPGEQQVPALALKRLRLHRLARTRPRGFRSGPLAAPDATAAQAIEFCTALIEGTRRWYAHVACRDATVQGNLARLAVLR